MTNKKTLKDIEVDITYAQRDLDEARDLLSFYPDSQRLKNIITMGEDLVRTLRFERSMAIADLAKAGNDNTPFTPVPEPPIEVVKVEIIPPPAKPKAGPRTTEFIDFNTQRKRG